MSSLHGITTPLNYAPTDWSMGQGVPGSFDDIKLIPKYQSSWRRPPADIKPREGKFFVPQGTPLPLKHEMIFQKLPKNPMFIFDRNVASPACCPSTLSTSTGCVCTTPAQRDYVGMYRGGNKTFYDYPGI